MFFSKRITLVKAILANLSCILHVLIQNVGINYEEHCYQNPTIHILNPTIRIESLGKRFVTVQ